MPDACDPRLLHPPSNKAVSPRMRKQLRKANKKSKHANSTQSLVSEPISYSDEHCVDHRILDSPLLSYNSASSGL